MPRPRKLKRDALFEAALAIIDRDGLDNLSMRRLGEVLGVEAMSLYRHVPNKLALLDGVHETVLDTMVLPTLTGHWRDDAGAIAFAFRAVLRAHPNTLPLFATRPAVTLGSLRHVERVLTILQHPFPDLRTRVFAFQALVSFCIGQALAHFAPPLALTAFAYDRLSADDFPILSSLGAAPVSLDIDDEFSFGLEALLSGLESMSQIGV